MTYLDILNHALSILLLVGTALGFIFKTSISTWIANRIAAPFTQEIDAQRHKLTLEMEAYKSTLLREMEQYRANIDLRRSIALKMAEARLEKLTRLGHVLNRFNNEYQSWTTYNPAMRIASLNELTAIWPQLRDAQIEAEIFLPLQLNADISRYYRRLSELANEFPVQSTQVLQPDDARLHSIRLEYSLIANQLRELITAPPESLNM